MDVSFINPFISSVTETFTTMFNETIIAGKPELKKLPFQTYDISGIIGLSGDAQGSIALSFPKNVALKVVSKMLGTTIKIVGAEVTDGIGELSNIITGFAKKDLSQYKLSISLPSVIIGKEHVLSTPQGIPTIVVPFQSALGQFAMEISLKTK